MQNRMPSNPDDGQTPNRQPTPQERRQAAEYKLSSKKKSGKHFADADDEERYLLGIMRRMDDAEVYATLERARAHRARGDAESAEAAEVRRIQDWRRVTATTHANGCSCDRRTARACGDIPRFWLKTKAPEGKKRGRSRIAAALGKAHTFSLGGKPWLEYKEKLQRRQAQHTDAEWLGQHQGRETLQAHRAIEHKAPGLSEYLALQLRGHYEDKTPLFSVYRKRCLNDAVRAFCELNGDALRALSANHSTVEHWAKTRAAGQAIKLDRSPVGVSVEDAEAMLNDSLEVTVEQAHAEAHRIAWNNEVLLQRFRGHLEYEVRRVAGNAELLESKRRDMLGLPQLEVTYE